MAYTCAGFSVESGELGKRTKKAVVVPEMSSLSGMMWLCFFFF